MSHRYPCCSRGATSRCIRCPAPGRTLSSRAVWTMAALRSLPAAIRPRRRPRRRRGRSTVYRKRRSHMSNWPVGLTAKYGKAPPPHSI
eukprot:scaffold14555_cov44-Phaeocystis_antarctica.AAC.2